MKRTLILVAITALTAAADDQVTFLRDVAPILNKGVVNRLGVENRHKIAFDLLGIGGAGIGMRSGFGLGPGGTLLNRAFRLVVAAHDLDAEIGGVGQ